MFPSDFEKSDCKWNTNPCEEVKILKEKICEGVGIPPKYLSEPGVMKNFTDKEVSEIFQNFFNAGDAETQTQKPLPKPVEYDDTGKSVKIAERYPLFGCANLIDEVLEDFGGVEEILKCEWNNDKNEGLVICLMKDWRVFRYFLKGTEYSGLSQEDRIKKLNRECQVFEDFDDWGHWEDLGGSTEENDKQTLQKKVQEEKMTVYGEKMSNAMEDFFNGNVDALSKMMSKNKGQQSILDAEA